ncbi:MAG: UDP-N-acetylmuramate dehydrogenase [Planctomycetota bacterium]|jgi:UDP-N-acetylmuramate dehydrogenase|nr:UDP-N-acetylmuramate dehydrogenase [Planctomycetota bacterium]MBM4056876.1 UDP-N-acetylmuramate dehydrogenase [Planctomycetota bacterium]
MTSPSVPAAGPATATPFDDLGIAVGAGEPLAVHTWLGVGGAARYFCEPVDREALARLVRRATELGLPVRVIGGGSNVLVPDAGFPGLVVRLSAPGFCAIAIDDGGSGRIEAGAGAKLVHLVTAAVQAGLAGLETLVAVPGTVGGALVGNAGARGGDIGDRVRAVTVMQADGSVEEREGARLAFGSRWSNLDDGIVLGCRLELDVEDPDQLTKRMQKQWIVERAGQPSGTRSVALLFKDPLGASAESIIAQAGCRGMRVGGASIHGTHANYVTVQAGASSDDVRALVEMVRTQVRQRLGVELAPQIESW